ncbi:unnamed protein product [Cutaneotrichosporon oleaginosum]
MVSEMSEGWEMVCAWRQAASRDEEEMREEMGCGRGGERRERTCRSLYLTSKVFEEEEEDDEDDDDEEEREEERERVGWRGIEDEDEDEEGGRRKEERESSLAGEGARGRD